MDTLNRRELLCRAGAAGALAVAGGALPAFAAQPPAAQATPSDTTRFFPGFKAFRVKTSGAEINGVIGGQGPPILLLHGAPLSHVTWRLVAPALAATHTVVVPDLRGYGDSSKPSDGENHVNYSKRAMALDQVETMQYFGFSTFPVIGQDRGGRVTQRLVLDHPGRVTHAAVLDIIPTHYLYTHVTLEFVQAYYHWFSYLRRAPIPENELKAANDARLAKTTDELQREYLRTMTDPATIHAMCEDYRAGASIDFEHDAADLDSKITCPLLVLWAAKGAMGRLYDVMAIWRERGTRASGKALPGGDNLQEDVPDMVLEEIRTLLKA
jgi:haloacetate dehalogenase